MKYILVAFSVFLVGSVLLGYTMIELAPFSGRFLVHTNLAVVLAEILLVSSALFATINMVVDQVVRKEILVNDAVRRGLLFGILVAGILGMKALGILSVLLGVLLALAVIVLEVIVMEMRKKD